MTRHAMIDKQAPSDLRPGMNLNAGPEACHLRAKTRQKPALFSLTSDQVVEPDSVQSGIAKQHADGGGPAGSRSKTDWMSSRMVCRKPIL